MNCNSMLLKLTPSHMQPWSSLNNALISTNKKRLKNVGPIRHCEPHHAHSPGVASGIVARRVRIHVHDNDNDNA